MKSRAKTATKKSSEPKVVTDPQVLKAGDYGTGVDLSKLPPPTRAPNAFTTLTGMPKGWKTAAQALDYVRAISTIFPDFDRATRIGGLPLRRITTIHGPTHEGKSAFLAGLLRSFIDPGHMAGYVDAEHATDLAFLDELLGRRTDTIPNFLGQRPSTYEETVDAADAFLDWMVAERKARFGRYGKAPIPAHENLAGILGIDSLNKLTPENEMERVKKEGGDALDKGLGRQRANMNQAWLDHIVPRLGPAETALVLLVQEREADDLKPWERPQLKGGKASQFDASMIIRITKSSAIARGEKGEKEIFGFAHRARIWKSKVGHMDGGYSDSTFHMSNGSLVAGGFDTARDVLMVAKELDIVTSATGTDGKKSSWMTWKKKRWNGDHNAVASLSKDPDSLAAMLEQVQARIRPTEAVTL